MDCRIVKPLDCKVYMTFKRRALWEPESGPLLLGELNFDFLELHGLKIAHEPVNKKPSDQIE